MKVVVVVQARMGSSRLPGKVMRPLCGMPLIQFLLLRLSQAMSVDEVIVATTDSVQDDALVTHLHDAGFKYFRGSEHDVLDRYVSAARICGADVVVRITGDCPLVMPELVDEAVNRFLDAGNLDYVSNIEPPSYPDGMDVEVFSMAGLESLSKTSTSNESREHVTVEFRNSKAAARENLTWQRDLSGVRLTVDEPVDLETIERVLDRCSEPLQLDMAELDALIARDPALFHGNMALKRNEGQGMSEGQKLWRRAKRVIPGGNMLLSKRAEMLLPEQWPTYFERATGCSVTDISGREFLDLGFMGIGTNTLGYGHPDVDAAVSSAVQRGNLSTLNCPEEVHLAERLVELNPWADMVRFARTGGEANAISIRIARAASGRDKVAICGYHGWHDWYLSANISDGSNLDGHLLPGLDPAGVPQGLANCTLPFRYNDLEGLEALVKKHPIGVIKMEVYRNVEPAEGFLEAVRRIADEHGIVLIFDECTSGFRETFGGLYQKYDVEPDIAVYGKTLGNGYAVTAVVGRRSVMESAQSSFISSTFWTERIGAVAALAALQVMQREESWNQITQTGKYFRARLKEVADRHGVDVAINGLPALTTYSIPGQHQLEYKTFITQENLKAGYLAPPVFYASMAHRKEVLDRFFESLDPTFKAISDCKAGRADIAQLLEGPVCHSGFGRLN